MPGGVISTVVPDSPHKIFIGGLPNYLNEDQVSGTGTPPVCKHNFFSVRVLLNKFRDFIDRRPHTTVYGWCFP